MACRIALIDPVRCGAAALLIATAPLVIYSGSYVTTMRHPFRRFTVCLLLRSLGRTQDAAPQFCALYRIVCCLDQIDQCVAVAAISILFAILLMKDRADDQVSEVNTKIVRSWLPNGGALLIVA